MRQAINKGKVSYNPNSIGGGSPFQAGKMDGGFSSYDERIDAKKVRERSASFFDHFSQAVLFYNSQSDAEQEHIKQALSFELGKVQLSSIRERMLFILSKIDKGLASAVAYNLGMHVPDHLENQLNQSVPADAAPETYESVMVQGSLDKSDALSMAKPMDNIKTRKIAVLIADGVDSDTVLTIKTALMQEGAMVELIAPKLGDITAANNTKIMADKSLLTTASVFYDAVFVPGGTNSVATLADEPDAIHFLNEAFKHCKPIAATVDALQVLKATYFGRKIPEDTSNETVMQEGIILNNDLDELASQFVNAIKMHRFWKREKARKVPA
jgi:catalase